jgi:hypothetical protein
VNAAPTAPTISAGGSTTFCSGGSVVLTSSSASGNTWSNGATTQSITVSQSGNYTVSVSNGSCSATSSPITVTVNPMPSTAVSISGSQLIANQSGAVYQWLDCLNNNISIFGATSSTFSPTQSGTYAVSVSLNGCTDTSSCYTVSVFSSMVNEIDGSKIAVYPNPSLDYFLIIVPDEFIGRLYTLYDARGRSITSGVLSSNQDKIEVSKLATGTYHLKIENVSDRFKLIKQ